MKSAARIVDPRKRKNRGGSYTFADFCAMVQDGQKADLLDGVIYMASPDNIDAGKLFTWFFGLLESYLDVTQLGQLYGQRIAFHLSDKYSPEPDIAFVKKSRLHLERRGFFDGVPDIAIEIVSPDSIERDYEKKLEAYEDARIPEYWILDEVEARVTVLRLNKQGKYRESRPRKGVIASHILPGFWFKPEWLWLRPRPQKHLLLNEILGPRM